MLQPSVRLKSDPMLRPVRLARGARDNELMDYVKRIVRGFEVTDETLACDVVSLVGPGGSYLGEDHTVQHFRKELWLPGIAWTRQTFGPGDHC